MIRVAGVTRRYGALTAVDQVSFEVQPGEIVGFLGPNGAGKSTLLKMLSTYLEPTEGRVEVGGHDTVRASLAARKSVGYLPEHNALYETMRVDRLLSFAGRAHGLSGDHLEQRLRFVTERCQLEEVLRKRISECSKGFRQRIGVAAALIHDPPALLLDEPTHGLDPLQVVAFRDLLFDLRPERAILFSSHILSEVLEISDRLLVIHRGKLLLDQPKAELEAAAGSQGVEAHLLDLVKESSR